MNEETDLDLRINVKGVSVLSDEVGRYRFVPRL